MRSEALENGPAVGVRKTLESGGEVKTNDRGGIGFRHLGKLGQQRLGRFLVLAEKLNGPGPDVLFGIIKQSHQLGILALESPRNLKSPQGPQTLAHALGILEHRFQFAMYLGRIQFPSGEPVLKNRSGLTHVPIVGMILHLDQFRIRQLLQVKRFRSLDAFRHDPVDPGRIGELDHIPANVLVVPIENINSTVRARLHTESDPGQIIGVHKVGTMLANEARALGYHVVDQHCMLVNVAHEKLVPVLLGEHVGQIKTCPAMSGFVNVIPNGLDVVVYVWVYVLLALFVVHASLHDMKKVRNDATGRKTLTHVVKVESPGVGQTFGKNFEFPGLRVETPDPTVDELAVFLVRTRLTNLRPREHPMTSVHPAVRSPNEAIEGLVTIMDSPTVEQDLMRTIGHVIPIGIGNEDQFGWHPNVNSAHAHGDTRTESKVFSKSLFLVEHAVPINVLEDLNTVPFVRGMSPSGLVVVIFQGPEPPAEIKTKGNGLSDIRLGHEGLDFEPIGNGHLGNGLVRFEKRRVASRRGPMQDRSHEGKDDNSNFHS